MRLDNRLSLVASLVRKGSRIADIGTDHAYLPVWLVERGISPSAVASDIHEGPVRRAEKTVAASGLSSRISIRRGNGLDTLAPGEADDLILAGMGGETIAAILSAAPWSRDSRYRLILQPMTKPELLRNYLLESGFALREEHTAEEGGHVYLVVCAEYSPADAAAERNVNGILYRGLLDGDRDRVYLENLKKRLLGAAAARREAGFEAGAREWEDIAFSLSGKPNDMSS